MKKSVPQVYPVAMTIAGSDSGGGAGIQADLRTFNAFGVFGCSAITAVTAQNPLEVRRIDAIPSAGVEAQIETVFDKICVTHVKCGMLFNADIVRAVARQLSKRDITLIIDPVMVSTSKSKLLNDDAIEVMKEELFPLADWVTPNLPEMELLLNRKLDDIDSYLAAAVELSEKFKCSCILKAGHMANPEDGANDIVSHRNKLYFLSSERIQTNHADHGTGCTLSAALTAALAINLDFQQALRAAKGFVLGSLNECVEIAPNLSAMYPPLESYVEKTALIKIGE